MLAIEFGPPETPKLRRWWWATERIRPAFFAQTVVLPLFHRHRILTQVAADNVNIIKFLPALTMGEAEIDIVAAAFDDVLADAHHGGSLLRETMTAMARGAARRPARLRSPSPVRANP
jgi:ornithine--oxo-acid transaminase